MLPAIHSGTSPESPKIEDYPNGWYITVLLYYTTAKYMMNRQIKLEHFVNLVAIAAADGYLDAREREFLAERAEENGMRAEEFNNIIEDADKLQFVVPLNQVECEDQLNDAVFMSMVDGDISDKEYQLCIGLANRLGIDQQEVETVIANIKRIWAK